MGKALCGLGLLVWLATGTTAPATAGADEPRPAVQWITGHVRDGFEIQWTDGTREHTPTLSEAVSECYGYQRRARRAACVASVRTEYRWMAELRRSLNRHGVNR